jgi:hypothetical protein
MIVEIVAIDLAFSPERFRIVDQIVGSFFAVVGGVCIPFVAFKLWSAPSSLVVTDTGLVHPRLGVIPWREVTGVWTQPADLAYGYFAKSLRALVIQLTDDPIYRERRYGPRLASLLTRMLHRQAAHRITLWSVPMGVENLREEIECRAGRTFPRAH